MSCILKIICVCMTYEFPAIFVASFPVDIFLLLHGLEKRLQLLRSPYPDVSETGCAYLKVYVKRNAVSSRKHPTGHR